LRETTACKIRVISNTQIVWDKIIQRKEYSFTDSLSVSRQPLKYPIRDIYKSLAGRTIKIRLWIEFMPIFGLITRDKYAEWEITVPPAYTHTEK
jgi:hypothetical protein